MENFLLFFGIVIFGVILEVISAKVYCKFISKKLETNNHSLRRYIFLLVFPMLAVIIEVVREGLIPLKVFLVFSLVGTFLEWLIGFSYHQVVGQRLWTYHKFSIKGYTSLLSVPLWGMGGVLFWLPAKVFAP